MSLSSKSVEEYQEYRMRWTCTLDRYTKDWRLSWREEIVSLPRVGQRHHLITRVSEEKRQETSGERDWDPSSNHFGTQNTEIRTFYGGAKKIFWNLPKPVKPEPGYQSSWLWGCSKSISTLCLQLRSFCRWSTAYSRFQIMVLLSPFLASLALTEAANTLC